MPEPSAVRPEIEEALLACCGSRRWARTLLSRVPGLTRMSLTDPKSYPDSDSLPAVLATSDDVFAALPDDDIRAVADAHPRIGESPRPDSRQAAWSRTEQSGAAEVDAEIQRGLAEGNAAYEQRFGHVFLISASGRSAAEMLAALRTRLGHDGETERRAVREELRLITRLRLEKVLTPP